MQLLLFVLFAPTNLVCAIRNAEAYAQQKNQPYEYNDSYNRSMVKRLMNETFVKIT